MSDKTLTEELIEILTPIAVSDLFDEFTARPDMLQRANELLAYQAQLDLCDDPASQL